jgi:hypothetical protein
VKECIDEYIRNRRHKYEKTLTTHWINCDDDVVFNIQSEFNGSTNSAILVDTSPETVDSLVFQGQVVYREAFIIVRYAAKLYDMICHTIVTVISIHELQLK